MGEKLTVGGNNSFLEPVNEVTLDSQFGTTLKQAISTINDNFKKIISVPFLKGEHGENIELIKVPILHDGVFTKLGEKVIKAIYETNATTYDPSLDDNFGGPVGVGDSSHSYDFMKNNCNEIEFYGYRQKTQVDEKIKVTSQQIFIFIDSRVGNIEDIESSQLSTFQDLSCALSITGDIYVDPETGDIDLLHYVAGCDCGTAINPQLALGQVQGAAMNAISFALTEEYMFDKKGRMQNPTFANYKIWTARDIKKLDCFLAESYEETGPYGAKSVSEININGALPSIANAIYNAVGVRLTRPPYTPEKILAALKAKKAEETKAKKAPAKKTKK